MEERLKRYIDGLFENAPQTKGVIELKEEMLQNLIDKYNDLLKEGKSDETAYGIAVAGIGDINELIKEMEEPFMMDPYVEEKARQRSGVLTAAAVMLYILSPLPLILLAMFDRGISLGVFILFGFVAAATGLLIYNGMTKPRYMREDDTMVEEFKEWQSQKEGAKALRRAVSSALWTVTLAVYFLVSFATGAWYISWVIFLVAAALESFVSIFFVMKR